MLRASQEEIVRIVIYKSRCYYIKGPIYPEEDGDLYNIRMKLKGIGIGYVDIMPIPIYRMRPISDNHE
jgi:hypothetical protein